MYFSSIQRRARQIRISFSEQRPHVVKWVWYSILIETSKKGSKLLVLLSLLVFIFYTQILGRSCLLINPYLRTDIWYHIQYRADWRMGCILYILETRIFPLLCLYWSKILSLLSSAQQLLLEVGSSGSDFIGTYSPLSTVTDIKKFLWFFSQSFDTVRRVCSQDYLFFEF